MALFVSIYGCIPYDSQLKKYKKSSAESYQQQIPKNIVRYKVLTSNSHLMIKVFKHGSLSKFGHNHVIRVPDLEGIIDLHQPLKKSTVNLSFAVANMVIDEEYIRKNQGTDFQKKISKRDKQATRNNMLSIGQLNANNYPRIKLFATVLEQKKSALLMQVKIFMLGNITSIQIPITMIKTKNKMKVVGTFSLTQSSLGIVPFSVLGGAISVADKMQISFDIEAIKETN